VLNEDSHMNAVVKTRQGAVRGSSADGVLTFKGIS
jgi:hypothetical protein